jgi:uncharacterized protein YdeI (YjbR/CyaY-like superfamily)
MTPQFFPTPADWRRWLAKHHASAAELWVGFHKRASGRPSITWPESVDEALCFGWIDGIRKSLGDASYVIRFTPRRPSSIWSAVNVRRVGELTRAGRMRPAGLRAFGKRTAKKTAVYSFEQRKAAKLPLPYVRRFKANPAAWRFFSGQAPWYQRVMAFYVVSAKQEETRLRRLARLIADSTAGRRVGILQKPGSQEARKSGSREAGKVTKR